MGRLTIPIVALASLAVGCIGPLFEPTEQVPASRTERVGQELVRNVAVFEWSADGREIFHLTYGDARGYGLWAVDPGTVRARRLDTDVPARPLASVHASNGPYVYYFRRPPDGDTARFQLVRMASSDGTVEVVDDSVRGRPSGLAVAPDGAAIAFATRPPYSPPSTMWVRRAETGSALRFDSLSPVAFSAGGDELLSARDNDAYLQYPCYRFVLEVDVVTGSVRNVAHGCAWLARWETAGPATIWAPNAPPYSRGAVVSVTRPGTGTRPVYTVPYTDHIGAYNAAWSPDGRRIAFWYDECSYSIFDLNPGGGPTRVCHKSLYLVDVETGAEHWLAGGDGFAAQTAFSPDGRWVAYLLGGVLFLDPVP